MRKPGQTSFEVPILVLCVLIFLLQVYQVVLQPACNCSATPGGQPAAHSGAASAEASWAAAPVPPPPPPPPAPEARSSGSYQAKGSSIDLLKELNQLQQDAKVQAEYLKQSGKMPPPAPFDLHPPSGAPSEPQMQGRAAQPPPQQQQQVYQWGGASGYVPPAQQQVQVPQGPQPLANVRRRFDFVHYLQTTHPYGVGVVLGVGRGEFALHMVRSWTTSPGLYLCDPYIHIWQGYDSVDNLSDKEHQYRFEDMRNLLAPYEGRYMLVRDFSYSFAKTYKAETQQPQPAMVYIDANTAYGAVQRDITDWWPLVSRSGLLAGNEYTAPGVAQAVNEFAQQNRLQVGVTPDDNPPSWYIVKP
mmetsp:Transcript_46406/g.122542  ORF Transcript_46406/g.122542 Transcript_46406/m.122542 type:complete len:358 (-) Transcript_46406:688-1761(-)